MSQRSNTPQGRRRRAPSKQIRQNNHQDPNLVLRPAFKGQVVTSMKLEGTPTLFTNTAVTGLVSPVAAVNSAAIANFAARFGSLYEEYRIVKACFYVRLFSSTNPGLLVSWVDEKVFTAPTLAESRTKSNMRDMFNASAVNTKPSLVWTPHDVVDQQFLGIGTSTTTAAFKIYGDNTNYGTSQTLSAYGEIFPVFTVQFRGLL
jgi:hypothetical protein